MSIEKTDKNSEPATVAQNETTDKPAAQSATEKPTENPTETPSTDTSSPEQLLETARLFLESDDVKNATRESKLEFLRSKGLNEDQIKTLLPEDAVSGTSNELSKATDSNDETLVADEIYSPKEHIATYPEFNAPQPDPEPLITRSTLLTTLYSLTGLATFMHGASTYVFQPMAEATADARIEYHQHAARNMDHFVTLLERTTSASAAAPAPRPSATSAMTNALIRASDALSEVDDPAELFSRDIGTQTSTPLPRSPLLRAITDGSLDTLTPSSPSTAAALAGAVVSTEPAMQAQLKKVARMAEMSEDITELGEQEAALARDLWQEITDCEQRMSSLKASIDSGNMGIFGQYGYTVGFRGSDEVQKAKDNIRKLKGMLLSSRNFPVATR
ncbi:hypothetical protein TD95_001669 [Thielaviopsis punctulata]|uniref:Peroxisome membrane anchor protein Pex14p N-terminal domain-containing protein n=1 Tax=Thielaviopsis punctulata TaxID=72032 RepID=A0A0F4ZH51_9PEZI|nr:hypothetical protein TD95_001669 [Thielaviopsis punctulata]